MRKSFPDLQMKIERTEFGLDSLEQLETYFETYLQKYRFIAHQCNVLAKLPGASLQFYCTLERR